jgi:hypothetical protein
MLTLGVMAGRAAVETTCWPAEIDEGRTEAEVGEHLAVALTREEIQVASGVEVTKRWLRRGGPRSKELLSVVSRFGHLVWLPISPPFLNERWMR